MYKDLPPPFDAVAEMAVLGSCFIDSEALPKILYLTPEDFYKDANRWTFEAMLKLHRQGIPTDQITVARELKKMGKLTAIGGAAFISHCVSMTPTSVHVKWHANIVKQCSEQRQQIAKGYQQIKEGYQGTKKHTRIEL